MAASRRIERVAEELRAELARVLRSEVADPRVALVTLPRVDLSPDLRNALRVLEPDRPRPAGRRGRTRPRGSRAPPRSCAGVSRRSSRSSACPPSTSATTQRSRRAIATLALLREIADESSR